MTIPETPAEYPVTVVGEGYTIRPDSPAYLRIDDAVEINLGTGSIKLLKPVDEAAKAFWDAVSAMRPLAPTPASRIREEALRALDALTAAARDDALDAVLAYLSNARLPSKVVTSMRRASAPPASAYEPEYAAILALIDAPQGGEGK